MENKKLPELCTDKDCTGCMACVNSCTKHALTQIVNDEGFYRPLLNTSICVGCLLCEKHCPILNPIERHKNEDIKVYAAWNLNEQVRLESSSGGAFSALAESVLERGGVVVGAEYTSEMTIQHRMIDNVEDLKYLRLSKYAQSSISEIFIGIKEKLSAGLEVLFVGTACQVAGLHSFLGKKYNNLITADLICHGVPSINFLQTYLEWIGGKIGAVNWINFRDKQKGWYDNLRVIRNDDGECYSMKGINDAYWIAFNRNSCLQESCYNCKVQGFPRCSDITLADYWKIGQRIPFGHKDEIEKGVSLIILNNLEKKWILEQASVKMYIEERTFEEAIGGNQAGVKSSMRPTYRENFYKDLSTMDFDSFIGKYMKPNGKEQLMKFFRERLPFWFIKQIRLSKQK